MTPLQKQVFENLKFYRKQKRLTQAQVAESCDMLASTYSRLETGQVSPQLNTLERVCDAIGIKIGLLFQSKELADKSIAQKVDMIDSLSEYNRNVVEIMMDSIIEKDDLEKAQQVKMKKRLKELSKVRDNS